MAFSRRFWLALVVFALALGASVRVVNGAEEEDSGWKQYFGWVPDPIKRFVGLAPAEEGDKILSMADILVLEAPREGFVATGQTAVLKTTLPQNGGVFPNLLLTLSIDNPGGDADLYCVPSHLFDYVNAAPGPDLYTWKSEHSQGNDYIFISRGHQEYEAAKVGVKDEGSSAEAISLICSVVGYAAGGSSYTVEMDVDYTDRRLVDFERKAMQKIYNSCCNESEESCQKWKAFTDADGLTSMDMCHIPGSVCDSEGKLLRLNLAGFNMGCDFPIEAISKLQNLQKLELQGNAFQGNLGEILEAFRLKESGLQHLDLSDNLIEGEISEMESLCDLTHGSGMSVLKLAKNNLRGSLQGCLFDEKSELRDINFDGNPIGGSIPEIPSNSSIMAISLAATGVLGTIPSSIAELQSLVTLDLSSNYLVGSIPQRLGSSRSLRVVRLNDNRLEGEVPGAIATSKSLDVVRLENNVLAGMAQEWRDRNSMEESRLFALYLSNNRIEGSFPSALLKATELTVLDIENNDFSGPLPGSPGMLPKVTVFLAGGNSFEGEIPSAFKNMAFLSSKALTASAFHPNLDLSRNKLTGKIPSFLFTKNVPQAIWKRIRLGGNQFDLKSCPLPAYLAHIIDLDCGNSILPVPAVSKILPKENLRGTLTRAGLPFKVDVNSAPEAEPDFGDLFDPASDAAANTLKARPFGQFDDGLSGSGEAVSGESDSGAISVVLVVVLSIAIFLVSVLAGVFLFRKRRKVQWERAVDAVLVKDFELEPSQRLQCIQEHGEITPAGLNVKYGNDIAGVSYRLP
ncbi:hypothetical protein BSKO_12672 [Bryopsis sp. KO-2023]|nr:hypothetical protein BSKO_12672 [Bryopsis sp. KO-2023]